MAKLRQHRGLKEPIGKGGRLIVCHAGSPSFGFVKNSKLVFRCKSGSQADYHSQMNATIFHKWFIDMLGNLKEQCIIVIDKDNATYHSTLTEEYLKANSKGRCTKMVKRQICRLFSSRNIKRTTGKSQIDDAKRKKI